MSERAPSNPENHQPGNEIIPVEYYTPVPIEPRGNNLPVRPWGNEVAIPEEHERSLTNYQIGQLVMKQELHAHLPEGFTLAAPGHKTTSENDPTLIMASTPPEEKPQLRRLELRKPINWDAATKVEETARERQKRHLYGNGQTDIKFHRSRTDRALDKVTLSKSTRNEGELVRLQLQLRDETLSNRKKDRLSRRAVRLQHRLSGQPGRPSRNAEDYEVKGMMIPAFRREVSHNRKMQRRNKEQETYKANPKTPRELWRSIRGKGEKDQDPPNHRASN